MHNIKLILLLFPIFTALSLSQSTAAETALQAATRLVTLVKPHEREAAAVRFMTTVSPIPLPKGVAECTVAKTTQPMKDAFAKLYADNLSEAELREALTFFGSKEGQAAVSLRLQHEENLYKLAAKGEAIASEEPEYPPQIKKALDAFAATPAGKALVGENDLASRKPFSSQISDLRDTAFGDCIQELAAKKGKP